MGFWPKWSGRKGLYLYRDPLRDGGISAPRLSTLIPSINWPHEWRRVSSKSHEWGQLIRGIWVDKRGADIPSVPIKGSRYRHYYFCSIWGPSIRDIHSNYRFVSHIVWNKEYEVHKLSTLSPASYDIICGWSPKHIRCDFFPGCMTAPWRNG